MRREPIPKRPAVRYRVSRRRSEVHQTPSTPLLAVRTGRMLLQESLTVEQAAKRLAVDASRVRQRLAAGTIYGLKVGGEWRLPAFQFRPQGIWCPASRR